MPSLIEGAKFDQDKIRLDLVSPWFVLEVAKVLTKGAEKYEPHNWAKGIVYSRVIGAVERHLNAFKMGEDLDPEWNLHHLAHLGCCVMFLLHYEMLKQHYEEYDDRPKWEQLALHHE